MKNNGTRHTGRGDQKSESRRPIPKLADLGISLQQSSDWQKLADVPQEGRPKKACNVVRLSDLGISERQASDWQKQESNAPTLADLGISKQQGSWEAGKNLGRDEVI
jgi:hypothetical protein